MTKQEFWSFFEEYMPALEQLLSRQSHDYAAYNALSDKLHEYNEYLIPEITIDAENHYILIVSCQGYKKGVPALERLTEDIKDYPNWKVIRYRQPGRMDFIPLNGHKVNRKDILLTWNKTSVDKYSLTFYLKWYLNNKTRQTGAILHLDHTIGEYDAMTMIEGVQFKQLTPFRSKAGLKTLDDLKVEIDAQK